MADKKLGRGLNFLISNPLDQQGEEIVQIELDQIRPNPFQPRQIFDEEALEELMSSIREHGLLQPILVRRSPGGDFEIIAGERRFRACRGLGRAAIPAIVQDFSDDQMLEVALVENVQREDLNPIEKAHAYRQMVDTLGITQEQAAERVGKRRSSVSNFLRLLDLPAEIQDSLAAREITMGHAKALLSLKDEDERQQLYEQIRTDGLSVRDTEHLTSSPEQRRSLVGKTADGKATSGREKIQQAHLKEITSYLRERFGTKVHIQTGPGQRGRIVLEFYSIDDFERLYDLLK
ncbi:MAG: ParB/RepB/Spo0J family partition protein [Planctomycetota bacterium]